jgi:hypothetical protein
MTDEEDIPPIQCKMNLKGEQQPMSDSESNVMTDGQSASLSGNKAPICGLQPDFCYCQTVAGLLMWGAVFDGRTGGRVCVLQLYTAGPLQRKSFSYPSPVGLATILYCLRFEDLHFVTSYDSQGHGGGIRPRPHTGFNHF